MLFHDNFCGNIIYVLYLNIVNWSLNAVRAHRTGFWGQWNRFYQTHFNCNTSSIKQITGMSTKQINFEKVTKSCKIGSLVREKLNLHLDASA